jgi:hypothetical protein
MNLPWRMNEGWGFFIAGVARGQPQAGASQRKTPDFSGVFRANPGLSEAQAS